MPIVRMVDGTGGGGSVKSMEQNPRTYIPTTPAWEWLVANMARAPVVSLALGQGPKGQPRSEQSIDTPSA
jgi:propionyl-CoA carboxylase beta chain